MRQAKILNQHEPYLREDKLAKPSALGRPHIIDVIWTLYPSNEVAEEIIQGNTVMKNLRGEASLFTRGNGVLK
jgi:hypothetical protein